jgi:hypothetical protein
MPHLITASYPQRKFVKSLLRHGSIKKAALEAYNTSEKNAWRVGKASLDHPMTQAYMKRIMDKANLTDDYIANGLKVIAEAGLSEQSLKQAKPQDALRAIQEVAKLKDLYPAEKKKIEKRTISIDLKGKTMEELQGMLEKQQEELKTFTKLLKDNVQDAEVLS